MTSKGQFSVCFVLLVFMSPLIVEGAKPFTDFEKNSMLNETVDETFAPLAKPEINDLVSTNATLIEEEEDDEVKEEDNFRPLKNLAKNKKWDKDDEHSEPGLWMVYDEHADRGQHKHAPACLLLRMKANLVIPVVGPDNQVRNRTIVVPKTAQVGGQCSSNSTNSNSYNRQQWITLQWSNSKDSDKLVKNGTLAFIFEKMRDESHAVVLRRVWASVDLFLDEEAPGESLFGADVPSQNLLLYKKHAHLWETPDRFSFVCHDRMEIALHADTMPLRASSGLRNPVHHSRAFLVVHELRVEVFVTRFARHFTHLQYDCHRKWRYSFVPAAVSAALVALVIFGLITYRFRVRLGLLTEREMLKPLQGNQSNQETEE